MDNPELIACQVVIVVFPAIALICVVVLPWWQGRYACQVIPAAALDSGDVSAVTEVRLDGADLKVEDLIQSYQDFDRPLRPEEVFDWLH